MVEALFLRIYMRININVVYVVIKLIQLFAVHAWMN